MRILLADDHEVVRRGVRALLEAEGTWTVCGEAADGLTAVALAAERHPDLAVLDVSMPGIDGLEACRRIRAARSARKVLLLTVHAPEVLGERARAAGADGWVLKSQASAALVEAVRALAPAALPLRRARGAGGEARARLTDREREVVGMVAGGFGNLAIAANLGISVRTVETHRAKAMRKLGVTSLVELVHFAVRHHLVAPERPLSHQHRQ